MANHKEQLEQTRRHDSAIIGIIEHTVKFLSKHSSRQQHVVETCPHSNRSSQVTSVGVGIPKRRDVFVTDTSCPGLAGVLGKRIPYI